MPKINNLTTSHLVYLVAKNRWHRCQWTGRIESWGGR